MKITLEQVFLSTLSRVWEAKTSGACAFKLALLADEIGKYSKSRNVSIDALKKKHLKPGQEESELLKDAEFLKEVSDVNAIEVEITSPLLTINEIEGLSDVAAMDIKQISWAIKSTEVNGDK